jgi:hypothetical protein
MSKHKNHNPNDPPQETKQAQPEVPVAPTPIQANGQESPYHCENCCKQKKSFWDKAKPIVEAAGIILLAVYTGYTIKQVHVAQRSSRPFVGVDSFLVSFHWQDEKGTYQTSANRVPQATRMDFSAAIKNFGPMPAMNFNTDFHMFVDGNQVPETRFEQQSETLFQSQIVHLYGGFQGSAYQEIMQGSRILAVNLQTSYDGPEGHYDECDSYRFVPETSSFSETGRCPTK